MKEIHWKYKINLIPESKRLFLKNDIVLLKDHLNNFQKVKILETFYENKIYKIQYDNWFENFVSWLEIFPSTENNESFKNKESSVTLHYNQKTIQYLMDLKYNYWLDLNPEYQRGLVWEENDKEKLIESIFNNVSIGTFVINFMGYESELMYESIDGKQRTTTLISFYEDGFKYKNKYFSEFSEEDKIHFLEYPISIAKTENLNYKEILDLFIKLNTAWKQIDSSHFDKLRDMLNNL